MSHYEQLLATARERYEEAKREMAEETARHEARMAELAQKHVDASEAVMKAIDAVKEWEQMTLPEQAAKLVLEFVAGEPEFLAEAASGEEEAVDWLRALIDEWRRHTTEEECGLPEGFWVNWREMLGEEGIKVMARLIQERHQKRSGDPSGVE